MTTSAQPSTGSDRPLHPSEVPALVERLEAKIAAEPRSERNLALDEAVFVLDDMRLKWDGATWAGIRALFDEAINRINALREA
ncbi:hypothetical protein [Terracoccus sp. 273MFTsu3.1]|uniref:hypothetical protein n=1 Tax=Terracoccus sp. 273MFTsu3.1 TaxID=1172188 RepID=UPI000369D7C7|nr:hypothetical protein [Terracoccus sp. 273MFTsu3.1]